MSLGGWPSLSGCWWTRRSSWSENIVQRLAHDPTKGRLPRLHTIYRATREIAVPVSAGILIIITVPAVLTLQDLEGKYFVPIALTIVFALARSLFCR